MVTTEFLCPCLTTQTAWQRFDPPIIDILLPLAICRSLVVNNACRERELTAWEVALGTDVSVTYGASVSTAIGT